MTHEETIKRKYYYLYLLRWGGGETPKGWVGARPIRIFGFFIGMKIKMRYAKDEVENALKDLKAQG